VRQTTAKRASSGKVNGFRITTYVIQIWCPLSKPTIQIPESLARQAVVLKIEVTSQEASFLSAFCPVTDAPMLAVI